MRLIGLFTDDPMIEPVFGRGEHPDATLYQVGWVAGRPSKAEYRDDDAMVTLEVRPVLPADTPLIGRMVVYEESGTDEVSLIRQRVGVYDTVLSERGLLGTVMSRLTGAPGAWSLPGGGLDADEEPTAGLLRRVHEEAGQQIIPGRLLTLQSDHRIGRTLNGGLEDCHTLCTIYSATYERPNHPRVHDLGGSTTRADWTPVRSWRRVLWT